MAFKYQVKRGVVPSTENAVSKVVDGEFFFDKTRNIMYIGNTNDNNGFVKIGSKGETLSVYNAFTHDERGIASMGDAIVPYIVINDSISDESIDIGTDDKPFNITRTKYISTSKITSMPYNDNSKRINLIDNSVSIVSNNNTNAITYFKVASGGTTFVKRLRSDIIELVDYADSEMQPTDGSLIRLEDGIARFVTKQGYVEYTTSKINAISGEYQSNGSFLSNRTFELSKFQKTDSDNNPITSNGSMNVSYRMTIDNDGALKIGRVDPNIVDIKEVSLGIKILPSNTVSIPDLEVDGNITADTVDATTRISADRIYGTIICESADWAEYFEWNDGNEYNEDRRGLAVTLNKDGKIQLANKGDHIIGVVSSKPLVTGDDYDSYWHGKYKKDIYGNFILDDTGSKILSEKFNEKLEYIPRKDRREWSPIALLGKVVLRDNGSCKVSGYASVFKDGVVMESDSGLLVINRLDSDHVIVLLH